LLYLREQSTRHYWGGGRVGANPSLSELQSVTYFRKIFLVDKEEKIYCGLKL
jgi:hypothetical protein